jgi:signal transduction histidine kinase
VNNFDFVEVLVNVLNSIACHSTYGLSYVDFDFRYRVVNKIFCDISGINPNVVGQKAGQFLSIENRELLSNIFRLVHDERESVSYIMVINPNKILSITSCPILYKDDFFGMVNLVEDITRDEHIKEKIIFKHSQLKSILENVPMIIYMCDKNLNYITGSKHAKIFVKNGYDELSDTQINRELMEGDEALENKYVLKSNCQLTKEKEYSDFKGLKHWYKIYKSPILDLNDEVSGLIILANNIDSEKQLQSNRETFVASLGHDLKNPTIAQIRGLELILKGTFGKVQNEQKEILEMILDSCRYMYGMLSSMLSTYRNDGGTVKLHFEEFSLGELVEECVSEMVYVAKYKSVGISINSSLAGELVYADRVQIKRVIMNLLSNGIKYAFKDSQLKLSISEQNGWNCFSFENKSQYIPKYKQEMIFARYVSFASAHDELGIGLGLYASKKIVEAHGGIIYLESYEDNRNIFGFKIPDKAITKVKSEVTF